MSVKKLLAVLLAAAMTVTVLFSCGGEGGSKDKGDINTLTADECLNKIFENSIPKVEPTTVATTVDVVSTGALDPYNRITYKSIVSPASESYVMLEVLDPAGFKTDLAVYSGSSGAVVSSRMFEDNYLVSVDFLKGLLADMGEMGQSIGGLLTGELGNITQDTELVKTVNKYMGLIEKTITSASDKKLVIEGESLGVTVTFNGDSVKKIIKDLYGEAKKDETLKAIVLDMVFNADPEGYSKFASEYEAFFGSEDALNEIFETINGSSDLKLVFTVTANRSFKLNSFKVDVTADGERASLKYETDTKDGETVSTVTAAYKDAAGLTDTELTLTEKTVKTEDGQSYTLELLADELNIPLVNITVDSEGAYVCNAGGQAVIEGTLVTDENKTELKVQKVTAGDQTLILNITVTVEYAAALPKFPTDYKTLSELSQQELNALLQTAKEDKVVRTLYDYFSEILENVEGNKGVALPDEA